jgi:hypothetical protein
MAPKVPTNLPDLGLNAHVFLAYEVKAAAWQRAQRQPTTSCKYRTNPRPQGVLPVADTWVLRQIIESAPKHVFEMRFDA